MKEKIRSAWFLLLIGMTVVVTLYLTGTLMNAYLGIMAEDLEVSRSLLSVNTTLRYLVAFGLNLSVDSCIRKLGVKKLILLGMASSGVMLLLLSTAQSLGICYLAGVIGGLGSCYAGVVPMALLVRMWFPDAQGTALAITSSMSGLAGVLITPLFSEFAQKCGWRVGFRGLAVAVFAIFALEGIFLRVPEVKKEESQSLMEEKRKAVKKRAERKGEQGREAVMLIAISCLFSFGSMSVYSNMAVVLQDVRFSQLFATGVAVSVLSLSNIAGKFIMGRLCDRKTMSSVLLTWYFIGVVASVYFAIFRSTNILYAIPGVVLIGFTGGIYSLPIPLMAGKIFNSSNAYTKVVGYCTAATNLSAAFAGFVFHKFYDMSGTYVYSLIYSAALTGVCTVLVWILMKGKETGLPLDTEGSSS